MTAHNSLSFTRNSEGFTLFPSMHVACERLLTQLPHLLRLNMASAASC